MTVHTPEVAKAGMFFDGKLSALFLHALQAASADSFQAASMCEIMLAPSDVQREHQGSMGIYDI